MRKSTIRILTIVMVLTFLGLLYVQILYMNQMVRMRNDQFAEGVKRSLYATTTRLEQDEAKHFLNQDMGNIQTQYKTRLNADGTSRVDAVTSSFTTPEGLVGGLTIKAPGNTDATNKQDEATENLRGLYLYQQEVLNQVILNIINQSGNRSIEERADSATVRRYLTTELANNGLELPFEFAVVNRAGTIIYSSKGYDSHLAGQNDNMFVQTLFPNDPKSKMCYIKVYFPTKTDYIFSSIKFMIPAFIFTFILMVLFIYTMVVFMRQKKLNEMKNDFINNMTHEFKTPISSISLASQMLNDPAVLKSQSMLKHISTVINDETKRLRFQVEKVLQMSIYDRGNSTMRLQEIDANTAVANIVNTFKLKVEKFGGSISTNLNATDAIVNVDEMHFTNVIFNLLDNAVKYRREAVPLHLAVTTRNINNHRLQIVIRDNGIGINRDDLKKIFEKFYRVSTGNRHDVKGFGLGLAYVKKIVTELHGEISVESEPNRGTKFKINLPLID